MIGLVGKPGILLSYRFLAGVLCRIKQAEILKLGIERRSEHVKFSNESRVPKGGNTTFRSFCFAHLISKLTKPQL